YNDTLSLREIDMLEADLLFKKGELRIALNKYSELEKIIPTHQPLFIKKGNAFLKLRKADLAIREFKKALALDPENHHAHHGIGIAMLNEKRYEEAVESLLTSLGINYRNPSAHYHLGNALDKIGRYEEAAKACEVCLSMSPKYGKARNLTIMIYEERLNMPGQAEAHRKTFRLNPPSDSIRRQGSDNNTIYVVSGLPRSGTSMMMQMLNGGGLEVFTDNKREADENNPKGYFEHEAVTRLARDKTWVKHARGKVVKVISRLLIFLPATYNYKVIFMVRDIDEVIASQQKMLEKKGKQGSGTYNVSLKENYEKNLEKLEKFIKENHNMEVIFIHYADVIGDPFKQALKINIFLDNIMNTDRMVEAVSRELYRTKLKNSNPGCTYINSALKNPG
ncbi:MAG: tetratricopeptide repeat protein, partial [Bacteroidetes bacterium]|nr:tetratricopeptide repeat protein [Bacteroidota bacterium]